MYLLLAILFTIKLYAHIDIFKIVQQMFDGIFLQPTDEEEIANIISSLNSNKASGPNTL